MRTNVDGIKNFLIATNPLIILIDRFENFNKTTGKFKAPTDGAYAFFFSGAMVPDHSGTRAYISSYVNEKHDQYFVSNQEGQLTAYWSLELNEGDEIHLTNDVDSLDVRDGWYALNFMGMSVQ